MRIILVIYVSFLVLMSQGCSEKQSDQNFSPKNGGFSILFSTAPQEMSYPDVASATNIKAFFVEEENITFFVNYRTLNEDILTSYPVSEVLAGLGDLAASTNTRKVIYERDFMLQGKPAKDVIYISQNGGQQRVWLTINNGRVFSIIVSASGVDLKSDKRALNFLKSFKLIEFNEGWRKYLLLF